MIVVGAGYTQDTTLPHMAIRNAYADATFSDIAPRSMQTYSFWTGPGELEADGAADIDYMACYIRDHSGATIQPEYLEGSIWTAFGDPVTPGKDGPILWVGPEVSALAVRLVVSGGAAKVGNFKAGLVDVIPVGIPLGYEPGYLNPQDVYTGNFSRRGQILGTTLERTGVSESLSFQDIEQGWIEANWLDIRKELRTEAAYFAWLPADLPDHLVYVAFEEGSASYNQGLYGQITLNLAGPSA